MPSTSAVAASEADAAAGGGGPDNLRRRGNNNPAISSSRTGGNQSIAAATKRQRRKQPNDKHLWPQHPNIRDSKARAKAYLRTAGLVVPSSKTQTSVTTSPTSSNTTTTTKSPTTPRQQPSSLDPALDLHSPQVKFGRLLGGTDQRVRHKALLQLQAYLKARCSTTTTTTTSTEKSTLGGRTTLSSAGLSDLALLKLWKGLWYTLYMADKTVVQDEVSHQIAQLIWCLAGTEEEDEYAGQAYLDLFGDDDDDHHHAMEHSDMEDDDDDDDDVTMEEIVNTLGENNDSGGGEDSSSDNDESSDNSSEESDKGAVDKEHCHDEDEDGIEEEDVNDSEVPHCRGAHLASLYVRTFFVTVRREWGRMDKYRVDKFYTLMRFMMQEIYRYMAIRHWNMGIIRLFNDAIFEEILSQTPNGLRFHLIDICLDELAKVNAKAPMSLTEATFLDVLEPFFGMAQTGVGDHLVQARVMENVLAKFLNEYSVVSENALRKNDDNDDKSGGSSDDGELPKNSRLIMDQVHVGTVAQFIFHVAGDGETHDCYRRKLYELHKTYRRRIKQVGKDVMLVDEEYDDAEDDNDGADENQQQQEPDACEADREDDEAEAVVRVSEDDAETDERGRRKETKKKGEKASSNRTGHEGGVKDDTAEEKEKLGESNSAESNEPDAEDTSMLTAEKRMDKKRKRKKKKKQISNEKNGQEEEEQEIIISLEDQSNAKKALLSNNMGAETTHKARVDKKRKKANDLTENEKRVKFGSTNRSRSWVASMKGLRTMETRKADVVPEKSILLNKHVKPKIAKVDGKRKGKRRKAVDYFWR